MIFKIFLSILSFLTPFVLLSQVNEKAFSEIQPMVQFQIPTTDGQTANALYILTNDQRELLIVSNKQGSIIVYFLSKDPSPKPPIPPVPPDPIPPIPPNPPTPIPQKLNIAIVEDVCCTPLKQKAVLADRVWRDRANAKHNFIGIIPSTLIQVDTGKPPAFFQPFINHAKDKKKPWIILYGNDGQLIYEGTVPDTSAAMNALLEKYGGK